MAWEKGQSGNMGGRPKTIADENLTVGTVVKEFEQNGMRYQRVVQRLLNGAGNAEEVTQEEMNKRNRTYDTNVKAPRRNHRMRWRKRDVVHSAPSRAKMPKLARTVTVLCRKSTSRSAAMP